MSKISKYTVEIKSLDTRWSSKRKAHQGARMLANSWKTPVGVYKLVKIYRPRGRHAS